MMPQTIQQICQQCRRERKRFTQHNHLPSPACVDLFRRVIETNDQATWACIVEIFEPLLRSWASRQNRFEVEDVVQETWLSFHRGIQGSFEIQDPELLAPILKYIRTCLHRVVAQMARKLPPSPSSSLDNPESGHVRSQSTGDGADSAAFRIDFASTRDDLFESAQFTATEQLLFDLKFIQRLKPREILKEFPDLFTKYDELEVALQRITRRVRKHDGFRNLRSNTGGTRRKSDDSAFLMITDEMSKQAEDAGVNDTCKYDDVVLLDYLLGMVDEKIALSIEASVACMYQVEQLKDELGDFLQISYRYNCPPPETLVDYQQKTLSGTDRLVAFRHITQCVRCQEDLAMLHVVAEPEKSSSPFFLRRVTEALYRPAVSYGLQGDWMHFYTPELFVNISTRQAANHVRTWTVRVQLRSTEGELMTEHVESAVLDSSTSSTYKTRGENGKSSLVFKDVEMGDYHLTLILPEEEIVIRKITVGSDI